MNEEYKVLADKIEDTRIQIEERIDLTFHKMESELQAMYERFNNQLLEILIVLKHN